MAVKNKLSTFRFCLLIIQFIIIRTAQAQDIITMYNDIEQQLIQLREAAGTLQSEITFYTAEVAKIGKNQNQVESFDAALILDIRNAQQQRGQELAKLLNSRDLWQRNFAVVNKTFANIRKKLAV